MISDKNRTPFNLGTAIQLNGFQLHEAAPLAQGLRGCLKSVLECHAEERSISVYASNPRFFVPQRSTQNDNLYLLRLFKHPLTDNSQEILKSVLNWTGGQPFLTQKIFKILANNVETRHVASPNIASSDAKWVSKIIKTHIIDNWETQDEPEHLKTIRDRILRNEKRAGRLLGLYQQLITPSTNTNQDSQETFGIAGDNSPEQMELRLTGLVVKRDGKLQVYNPIYQQVFNVDWVEKELAKLRPYSQTLRAWLETNREDESKVMELIVN